MEAAGLRKNTEIHFLPGTLRSDARPFFRRLREQISIFFYFFFRKRKKKWPERRLPGDKGSPEKLGVGRKGGGGASTDWNRRGGLNQTGLWGGGQHKCLKPRLVRSWGGGGTLESHSTLEFLKKCFFKKLALEFFEGSAAFDVGFTRRAEVDGCFSEIHAGSGDASFPKRFRGVRRRGEADLQPRRRRRRRQYRPEAKQEVRRPVI